jgi:hypothetical protein
MISDEDLSEAQQELYRLSVRAMLLANTARDKALLHNLKTQIWVKFQMLRNKLQEEEPPEVSEMTI